MIIIIIQIMYRRGAVLLNNNNNNNSKQPLYKKKTPIPLIKPPLPPSHCHPPRQHPDRDKREPGRGALETPVLNKGMDVCDQVADNLGFADWVINISYQKIGFADFLLIEKTFLNSTKTR
jgi:hypothetical protein